MTLRNGIFLINPPFTDSRGPYVAIPQLAAYLHSRQIPVKAADLGAAFLKRLLTPEAIARGGIHAAKRFRELNQKASLSTARCIEYQILVRLLREFPAHAGTVNWLSTPFADFSDIQNEAKARSYLLLLASIPYFPEIFLSDHHTVNPTRFSPFSSRQLLAAAGDDTPYTRIFRQILTDAWPASPPRIAGFSVVFTHQIVPAFQMAAMIKTLDPGVHITMGGPGISIFFRKLANPDLFNLVDSLILDEGEFPLERLYQTMGHSMDQAALPLHQIPGIICRRNGAVHKTTPGPAPNITDLPDPNPTIFDLDQYLVPRDRFTFPISIGRGCTWQQCSFCRTGHPLCCKGQDLSGDQIFEMIRRAGKDHGIRRFFFSTESADPVQLETLSRRITADKVDIQWLTHTRIAKGLTRDRCRLFSQAGCTRLAVGVESMSPRILSLMRKGITPALVTRVLGEINGSVPLNAYMMVGFPGETREEALLSFQAVKDFKRRGLLEDFSYSMFVLQQESAIFERPEEFGITRVVADPDEDLCPDLAEFKGAGMDREEAFALYLEFLKTRIYTDTTPREITHVPLNGRTVPLAHSLESLRKAARTQWHSLVTPFGKWICDQEIARP